MVKNGSSTLWKRILSGGLDDLKPDVAKTFLEMKFNERDRRRIHTLSVLAQRGKLTEAQADELDVYLQLGNMLGILHSKARLALKRRADVSQARRKSA